MTTELQSRPAPPRPRTDRNRDRRLAPGGSGVLGHGRQADRTAKPALLDLRRAHRILGFVVVERRGGSEDRVRQRLAGDTGLRAVHHWTVISALLLVIPCLGLAWAVSDPAWVPADYWSPRPRAERGGWQHRRRHGAEADPDRSVGCVPRHRLDAVLRASDRRICLADRDDHQSRPRTGSGTCLPCPS
jgi:hypothetical protein